VLWDFKLANIARTLSSFSSAGVTGWSIGSRDAFRWIFSTGIFFSGLLKSSADMLFTNMQIILNVICCTSGTIFSTFTLAKLGIVIGFLLQIKVHCSVNSSHR